MVEASAEPLYPSNLGLLSPPPDLCASCGHSHKLEENHEYLYQDEVDDDLVCQICLQPLIRPLDTPCGHTYCQECLTSFLLESDFCPVCRDPLMLQSCRKPSLLVHKLLDKLMITCPFTEHCTEKLARGQLEDHIKNRCKGASHYGLSADRKRRSQEGDCTDSTSELTIATLPNDSPTSAAVALLADEPGLVNPAFDPTMEDNSQSGSMTSLAARCSTKKIRNFDRSSVRSRSFKRLNRALSVLRKTKTGTPVSNETSEERDNARNSSVPPEADKKRQLENVCGCHVKAAISRPHAFLLCSILINPPASEQRVHFIVSRQICSPTPDIPQEAPWGMEGPPPYSPVDMELTLLDSCQKPACYEKTVTLTKEPYDSLGMTVAGGMSSRGWDLPIYVTNVDPDGVVGQEGSIRKGDILLNVNGLDLTGVTRSEAVANLKNTSSPVVLKVLEMRPPEESLQEFPLPPCLTPSPTDSIKSPVPNDDYSPLWVSWLQLPRHLYYCKDIVLRRNTSGSLGFSIVGGQEEINCNQSFFIRSIVEGTPAYNDGRIRCGDILLEVNGKSTWGLTHTALVRLLKELRGRITLTIVSWPGSLL
uniref:Ligand of numb-protein X 1 n=1 Tax=Oryzias sinensis TaxID=183150 RepID=A0A8C8DZX5_9TELE